jgi:hypothetical protein
MTVIIALKVTGEGFFCFTLEGVSLTILRGPDCQESSFGRSGRQLHGCTEEGGASWAAGAAQRQWRQRRDVERPLRTVSPTGNSKVLNMALTYLSGYVFIQMIVFSLFLCLSVSLSLYRDILMRCLFRSISLCSLLTYI